MKALARSYVYWPGIDTDIERTAKSCCECARQATSPPKFSNHHWQYPNNPWDRIHVDYAGPIFGTMLLIVVDAFSKWVEVKPTQSTTTAATIQLLDDLFAAYGAPVTIVSDNGTQFTSSEFKAFLQQSGVKFHKLSAPYHPATNGQAERYVQTVKRALRAMGTTSSNLQTNINQFLQQYRKVPHSETGESPAKMFLGRNIRTRLDLVRPRDAHARLIEKQQTRFEPTYRSFLPGQQIYCLSGNPRMDKWIPATILSRLGDLHYDVLYQGRHLKRHIDQIRSFLGNNQPTGTADESETIRPSGFNQRRHYYNNQSTLLPQSETVSTDGTESSDSQYATPVSSPERTASPELRRSERIRRPPNRYSP
ncbi:uncharacterized protein K02A2.6-like [Anopheles stephensi]|uniref:uncharacterized protein K02A2.6-like n=1 Tax=Anopheles stephensi TaxID=30069 RepID=UPI0016587CC1|nr:uncharacterized protein K02A2.6-like [Anopheles stephensi]